MQNTPPKVVRLAAGRGLGELVKGFKGDSPLGVLAFCFGGAAVLFGVAAGINWLAESVEFFALKPLAIFAVVCVLGSLGALLFGLYSLMQGYCGLFVFQNGVVWTRNTTVDAVEWAGVDRLHSHSASQGKMRTVELLTLDGRTATVSTDANDAFLALVDALETGVRRIPRPVDASPFAEARRRSAVETAMTTQTIGRIMFPLALVGIPALGVGLWLAGMYGPLAAVLAPVLLGVVMTPLAALFDPRLLRGTYFFYTLAVLVAWAVVLREFEQFNGVVVTVVFVAVVAAVATGLRTLHAQLPMPGRARQRRKFAAQSGGQYSPQLTVPIGGPRTAHRLIGVPNHARETHLVDAVQATVNNFPVIVGDRVRRKPKIVDEVQAVWVVRLPLALPYFASSYFAFAKGQVEEVSRATDAGPALRGTFEGYQGALDTFVEATAADANGVVGALADHTADERLARVLADSRLGARGSTVEPWWVEGPYLYALPATDQHQPDSDHARLTTLLNAFPWGALREHARG